MKNLKINILILCVTLLFFIAFQMFNKFFNSQEYSIQDFYTKTSIKTKTFNKLFLPPDNNIIILEIDDIGLYEINKLEQGKVTRDKWAKIINQIEQYSPKVLLLNLLFENYEDNSLGTLSNDNVLANTLKKYDNIVLATKVSANASEDTKITINTEFDNFSNNFELPANQFNIIHSTNIFERNITYYKHSSIPYMFTSKTTLGVNNLFKSDNKIRQFQPIYKVIENTNEYFLPSVSFATALKYIDYKGDIVLNNNKVLFGHYGIKVDKTGKANINWHSLKPAYTTIPLSAFLVATKNYSSTLEYSQKKLPLAYFKDKIIIISNDANDKELHNTPVSTNVQTAEIIATAIDNILNDCDTTNTTLRKLTSSIPQKLDIIITLVFVSTLYCILRMTRKNYILTLKFIFFSFLYVFMSYFIYTYPTLRLIIPVFKPLLCGFAIFIIFYINNNIQKEKRTRYINTVLGKSISPDKMKKLVRSNQNINLDAGKQEITIMSCSIPNFYKYSQTYDTKILLNEVNKLFKEITNIVFNHNGNIETVNGDKIQIFWTSNNNPNHAIQAVECAIEINEKISSNQFKLDERTSLTIQIAINTDIALVGCVGTDTTNTYTVMGTCIDDLSHISKIATNIQTPILISEYTYEKSKQKIQANYKGELKLPSKNVKIKIYEPTSILD